MFTYKHVYSINFRSCGKVYNEFYQKKKNAKSLHSLPCLNFLTYNCVSFTSNLPFSPCPSLISDMVQTTELPFSAVFLPSCFSNFKKSSLKYMFNNKKIIMVSFACGLRFSDCNICDIFLMYTFIII